ncbi:hypothetical protein D3C78_1827750 [compost metagenome]
MGNDHGANEERQGFETVGLGRIGPGLEAGLPLQPGTRVAVVKAALLGRAAQAPAFGHVGADHGQQRGDQHAPVGDGEMGG